VNLKSVFRIGLGNVIFLWAELHNWREKHLVLLISQKDYEHIYKCEVWDRDSELRNWNWLNVDCLMEILQVKCVGGFNGGLWKWIVERYFSLFGLYNWIEKASSPFD
jgi:hypothetical protein